LHAKNINLLGDPNLGIIKKTKLQCDHPDQQEAMMHRIGLVLTHEHAYCEHFEWGSKNRYSRILKEFPQLEKE